MQDSDYEISKTGMGNGYGTHSFGDGGINFPFTLYAAKANKVPAARTTEGMGRLAATQSGAGHETFVIFGTSFFFGTSGYTGSDLHGVNYMGSATK